MHHDIVMPAMPLPEHQPPGRPQRRGAIGSKGWHPASRIFTTTKGSVERSGTMMSISERPSPPSSAGSSPLALAAEMPGTIKKTGDKRHRPTPLLREAGRWQVVGTVLLFASIFLAAPLATLFSETRDPPLRPPNVPDASPLETRGQTPLPDPSVPLVALSPLLLVSSQHPWSRDALVSAALKPLVLELGAVVLCQAVGLPLLSKLGVLLRRLRVPHVTKGATVLARRFPAARVVARQVRAASVHSGRAWKAFGHVYKQTSLSKIVNRSKKLLKVFVDHHHHDDDSHAVHRESSSPSS